MRRIPALLIGVSLLLTACAGSEGDATTSTADTAATTTTVADTTTTTTSPQTTTTAGQPAEGTDDCLVGTWLLDSEAFVENFGSIFADAGMPGAEVTSLDGTFTVELGADGSLTGTRDDWGFNIVTGEGTIIMEINGTETGTWSADGSTLTVETLESDLSVNASMEVDGEVFEMPQGQVPIEAPPGIASNSEYTCSGDTLTLTNAGVESVLTRS